MFQFSAAAASGEVLSFEHFQQLSTKNRTAYLTNLRSLLRESPDMLLSQGRRENCGGSSCEPLLFGPGICPRGRQTVFAECSGKKRGDEALDLQLRGEIWKISWLAFHMRIGASCRKKKLSTAVCAEFTRLQKSTLEKTFFARLK